MRSCQNGFTLIELSIVLVIIGLIVGGVFVGQEMIRAAEIRNLVSTVEKFQTSIYTFKNKYNCLPGDCANATQFFGQAGTCDGSVTLSTQATCNGDGNNTIGDIWPGRENYWAAHQLMYSNLGDSITDPGNFAMTCNGTPSTRPGFNVPSVKWPKSRGIAINYVPEGWVSSNQHLPIALGNNIVVSGSYLTCDGNTTYNWWQGTGFPSGNIDCAEMKAIDAKYDDGYPSSGNIFTGGPNIVGACLIGSPSTYNINTVHRAVFMKKLL